VLFRQPILYRWRQQVWCLSIDGFESCAHAVILSTIFPDQVPIKSDRLLG
jgi:hypothetical protein